MLDFLLHVYFGGDIIRAGRILVMEQDEELALEVATALEEAGYTVVRTNDTRDGLRQLYEACPDLIILARELPMLNGEDPCLRVRQACYLPIIVLGNNEDASEMLELGADAYMMKPPGLNELVARVHSLLRRRPTHKGEDENSRLKIESERSDGGNGASLLTATEFRLASCLVLNKGSLLEYPRLIGEVWGGKEVSLDTLHYYMRRLQQKLQAYFPYRINIQNFRGVGYCLSEDGSAPE
jgi:two-component system KDP operon response regulator KdpE